MSDSDVLSALARAAAAGECEARVPISPPLPDDAGPAMLRSVSEPSYQVWKRVNDSPNKLDWYVGRDLPLTPGEVVEVPCQDATWGPVHHDQQPSGCGCLCHEGEWGDWPAAGCEYCYAYHQSCPTCGTLEGQLSVRILSVTPERGCKRCKGGGVVVACRCGTRWSLAGTTGGCPHCDRPPGDHLCSEHPCPTCHGTPGWVDWLVRFEVVENG